MLVSLKRDWFAPGGVLHRRGTIEYNGAEEELPSDAVIVSENGRLPVRSNTPKAGHGAKPMEEQVLDLIPGAGPTHLIPTTPGPDNRTALTDEEKAKAQAEQDRRAREESEAKAKDAEKAEAELQAEVEQGVANAEKAAEAVKEATDPLSPFSDTAKSKSKK